MATSGIRRGCVAAPPRHQASKLQAGWGGNGDGERLRGQASNGDISPLSSFVISFLCTSARSPHEVILVTAMAAYYDDRQLGAALVGGEAASGLPSFPRKLASKRNVSIIWVFEVVMLGKAMATTARSPSDSCQPEQIVNGI
ncbi:hypothetical protein EJB05_04576 [Eragrostis curvula]|uniref:Uncharacterized protein n=1 Tax=Eragrostis curvula TaxID=38414 RepID=A0A5J9WAU9_9POAL|nr:hypothetical protein EJB05_04576 [Eragrostis curvula]